MICNTVCARVLEDGLEAAKTMLSQIDPSFAPEAWLNVSPCARWDASWLMNVKATPVTEDDRWWTRF